MYWLAHCAAVCKVHRAQLVSHASPKEERDQEQRRHFLQTAILRVISNIYCKHLNTTAESEGNEQEACQLLNHTQNNVLDRT